MYTSIHLSNISFILIKGRHFGVNIKNEYDKVIKFYDLKHKIFKVITDQAANMRKAFENEAEARESDEVIKLTNELLLNQIKLDKKNKQDILRAELMHEIDVFNSVETTQEKSNTTTKQSRDEVLANLLDDSLDDITDTISDHNTSSDTIKDADDDFLEIENLEILMNEFLLEDEISKFQTHFFLFNYLKLSFKSRHMFLVLHTISN
jgi:hypothetical protein